MKIAIIGAGVTGSLLAHKLSRVGHQVEVFEKSRGRGGRCSHKRTAWGAFDMGAMVIPASDPDFVDFMQNQVKQGVVAPWPGKVHQFDGTLQQKQDARHYFVFTPGMNAGCRQWLSDSTLHTDTRVTSLQELPQGWLLWDAEEGKHGPFDLLVVTVPWPQSKTLLSPWLDVHQLTEFEHPWMSCWSVGVRLQSHVDTDAQLVYVQDRSIQCLVNQSAKPGGQAPSEVWVVQFDNGFSDQHHDAESSMLLSHTQAIFQEMFAIKPDIEHSYQHFWRYARPVPGKKPSGIVTFNNHTLLAGGDWSYGCSVQAAFQAANRLFVEITR